MREHRPLLGVSACLFRSDTVLLVERAKAPYQGKVSLPGGKVRFGETLHQAVRRELREETGLDLRHFHFFRFHEAIGADFHAVIAVFVAGEPIEIRPEPVAADDASACRFHAVADLSRLVALDQATDGLDRIVEDAYRDHSIRQAGDR